MKYFKYAAIFLIFPLMVGLTLYGLDQQGFFHVNEIQMQIVAKPSQKNFIKPYADKLELKLLAFKGISLLKFPMKNVSVLLQQQNWVKDFRISRSWPSAMVIELEPVEVGYLIQFDEAVAKAVAGGTSHDRIKRTEKNYIKTKGSVLVKDIEITKEKNVSYFIPVTTEGKLLDHVDSKQTPNVAVARGDVFLKSKKIREDALEILKSLPTGGNMHQSQISEIGYDKKDGFWVGLIREETKVKFGENQFALKASRVSQVLSYLEQRDLKARVIDANLSKKVLVRLQQTP